MHYGACHQSQGLVRGREPSSDRKLEANFDNRGPHVGRPFYKHARSLRLLGYFVLSAIDVVEAPVCLLLFR